MSAPLAAAIVAAGLAGLAVWLLLRARARLPHAAVSSRGLHGAPVPRVGGLAIWAGFVPVALWAAPPPLMAPALWGVPWLLLAGVSLRDDVRSVPVGPRLFVHLLAAAAFAFVLARAAPVAWPLAALAGLVCVWSLNLYNFMDGSDGLAASMSIAGFAAYAAVLAWNGLPFAVPLALAAATVPVLAVNRPRARMFLGDVGAVPLGFLAAAWGIGGIAAGAWPAWFPVLVFLPFIADATATLARRVLRRERFWEAHRSHYYQRLHRLGAGHAGTLAAWGALMAGTCVTAVVCATVLPGFGEAALLAWCAVHAAVFAGIDYHWRRNAPAE
ncbi:MAG: glycosyl transferase [Burkholderiales bacterium]